MNETRALQERGKQLYKQGRYRDALETFNQALKGGKDVQASLIDNRAATYEKLGQLDAALKDARATIRLHKTNVTGYLRSARLLRKMDKDSVALGVCAYGLRFIPPSDEGRKLLQALHDKIQSCLAPVKAEDPFLRLPIELVFQIIDYFEFHQLAQCLRVSKSWYQFLTSQPRFWQDFDLSKAKRIPSITFIRAAVRRSKGGPKRAVLNRLGQRKVEVLKLISQCRKLEDLELAWDDGTTSDLNNNVLLIALPLRRLVLGSGVPFFLQLMQKILESCPNLEHAEFYGANGHEPMHPWEDMEWRTALPKLRILKFGNPKFPDRWLPFLNPNGLVKSAPNLEVLSLEAVSSNPQLGTGDFLDCSGLARLREINLRPFSLHHYPSLPPTVERIVYYPRCSAKESTSYNPSLYLPKLASLILFHGADWIYGFLHRVKKAYESKHPGQGLDLPSLKKFRLRVIGGHGDERSIVDILSLPGTFPNVEDLEVNNCLLKDADIPLLAQVFPRVKHANLSTNPITGVTVRAALQAWPDLGSMTLCDCPKLSSDAVDLARARGVKVTYYFSQPNQSSQSGRSNRLRARPSVA